MEIITVSEPECGAKPTLYMAVINDRHKDTIARHLKQGLSSFVNDADIMYVARFLSANDYAWIRERYLIEITELDEDVHEAGDVSKDPAYKCPYCGGRNCEFEDAPDPGEQDGYFNGSKFHATWWCKDCGKAYDVEFTMNVTDVKPTADEV